MRQELREKVRVESVVKGKKGIKDGKRVEKGEESLMKSGKKRSRESAK
jgi:hypothetical protein